MKHLRVFVIVIAVLTIVFLPGCKDAGTVPLSVLGTWASTADKEFPYVSEDVGALTATFESGATVTLGQGTFAMALTLTVTDNPDANGVYTGSMNGTVAPANPVPLEALEVTITSTTGDLPFVGPTDTFSVLIKNLTSTTCDADMDLDSADGWELLGWAMTKQ